MGTDKREWIGQISYRARMPSIIVKDSIIHGRGVFAARDILPGEVIIDWDECSKILPEPG